MTGTTKCHFCSQPARPVFAAGDYWMYRCESCRLAFVDPTPDSQKLNEFYARFHLPEAEGGTYTPEIEIRMQADFPAKVALVHRACKGQVGRLIDVGCGKGFFVRACVRAGIDAQGVDLAESGVRYATEVLGVRAARGELNQVKDQLGRFQTATLWATIEHLTDPIGTLRDVYDVLEPGGRLFLDTGIGDDWLDRLLPGVNQWYDPPQHLYVFSRRAMSDALEVAGFRDVSIDPSFERSTLRRLVRTLRGAALAGGLKAVATACRMKVNGFTFTRYPIGNLMAVTARKPLGAS